LSGRRPTGSAASMATRRTSPPSNASAPGGSNRRPAARRSSPVMPPRTPASNSAWSPAATESSGTTSAPAPSAWRCDLSQSCGHLGAKQAKAASHDHRMSLLVLRA